MSLLTRALPCKIARRLWAPYKSSLHIDACAYSFRTDGLTVTPSGAMSHSSRQRQLTLLRGSSRSGGAPSQLTACFVADTLESGELQDFVYNTLQPTYCKRYRKMVEVINQELIPLGVRLPQTDREVVGGYFIWLTLPKPLKGAVLAQRAKEEENVVVAQVSTEHNLISDPSRGDN